MGCAEVLQPLQLGSPPRAQGASRRSRGQRLLPGGCGQRLAEAGSEHHPGVPLRTGDAR